MTAEELGRILDELGERLGPTGAYVFELAVRQQVIVNGLWTGVLVGVAVTAAVIAIRTTRTLSRMDAAIAEAQATVASYKETVREVESQVNAFRSEREKVRLDAMTDEQRAAYLERTSFLNGLGGSRYWDLGRPFGDAAEADHPRYLVVALCGVVAALALAGLLLTVPSLLNPEYAALRDILGAIR